MVRILQYITMERIYLLYVYHYDNLSCMKHFKELFKGIDRKTLARALKTSRNVVDQFIGGFRQVSPRRARDIEKATGGKVPAKVLRPDIFG